MLVVTPDMAPGPPADAGLVLLPLARAAIARHLGPDEPTAPDAPWLDAPGACFVTLTSGRTPGGALRGCIGSLEARRPLREDVEANAVAAACRDPRFPPLGRAELDDVVNAVKAKTDSLADADRPTVMHGDSVYTTTLPAVDEPELLARLRPGVDGVILSAPGHRATFLPQVWDQLPDPAEFLSHLRRKAGLPAGYRGRDVVIEIYTVTAWLEPESGVPSGEARGGRP